MAGQRQTHEVVRNIVRLDERSAWDTEPLEARLYTHGVLLAWFGRSDTTVLS